MVEAEHVGLWNLVKTSYTYSSFWRVIIALPAPEPCAVRNAAAASGVLCLSLAAAQRAPLQRKTEGASCGKNGTGGFCSHQARAVELL